MKEITFKKEDNIWIVYVDGKAIMRKESLPSMMRTIMKWIIKEGV